MNQIFFRILNMSIMAGLLSIVVILLRLLFKRVPKWIICLLWAIVALRLIIPFNIESPVALMPEPIANGTYVRDILETDTYVDTSPDQLPETAISAEHPSSEIHAQAGNESRSEITGKSQKTTFINWLKDHVWMIWAAGAAIMMIYALFSFARLKLKLRTSLKVNDAGGHIMVYANDDIVSPFLLGLIRPVIYVPSSLCADTGSSAFRYVLKHEQAHVSRWDHIWKPLGFLLLSINWFNPLLWAAYVLLCRDIEAACDEKVIKDLGSDELADYSRTLLALSSPRREIAACPVAFGETGTKSRIKAILNYKKPAFWIIIAAITICIAAAVCLLTIRPGAKDASGKLMKMYLMEADATSPTQPHISINTEEQSFIFNWNRQPEIGYAEEGHYDIDRDRIILHVEKQWDGYPEDRTGLSYTFRILDKSLQFLKDKSSPIPLITDADSAAENVPDKAVFRGVEMIGTWVVRNGISILDENSSEQRSTDLYVIFGNKFFDGNYATGWTLNRVPFVSGTPVQSTAFLYKIEGDELLFAPDEASGYANSPLSSPAKFHVNADGTMSLRQWGEDTLLEPSDLPWWATGEEYKYFYTFDTLPKADNSPSEFSEEPISEIPSGNSVWEARSYSSVLGINIRPAFEFINVNTAQGTSIFTMRYDPLSSYLSTGIAIISDDRIVCSTDDKKYTYVLLIDRDGPSISLVFDEASSVVPADFTQTIPDGTEFGFAGSQGSGSSFVLETDNTPLLTEDDIGLQRWDHAVQEDSRLVGLQPIAIIGSRNIGLGIDPSDTNKFAYLAFSPTEDEYPAGWRIVVLEVGEPMVAAYNHFSDQIFYTLNDGQIVDTDWEFGLNTTAVSKSEHFTSDELNKLSLSDSSAQAAFNSIKDELPDEMYPLALLGTRKADDIDYLILCATDASEGNGDNYVLQLTVSGVSNVRISECDRLNMPAYINAWQSDTTSLETGSELTEELAALESEAQLSEMAIQEEIAMQEIESQLSAEESSANWDTTDSEEMIWNMNNDPTFAPWRYMLTFMPQYSSDDADELLNSVIDNGRYYLLKNKSELVGGIYFEEEDVKQFMTDIFHISSGAYDHALKLFFDIRSTFQNPNYKYDYETYLNEGLIHGATAGQPTTDVTTVIDTADYLDGLWHVSFHEYNLYYKEDDFSKSGTAVMERIYYNGEWTWTFYSLTRNSD